MFYGLPSLYLMMAHGDGDCKPANTRGIHEKFTVELPCSGCIIFAAMYRQLSFVLFVLACLCHAFAADAVRPKTGSIQG
jgi:hypothetical protein